MCLCAIDAHPQCQYTVRGNVDANLSVLVVDDIEPMRKVTAAQLGALGIRRWHYAVVIGHAYNSHPMGRNRVLRLLHRPHGNAMPVRHHARVQMARAHDKRRTVCLTKSCLSF